MFGISFISILVFSVVALKQVENLHPIFMKKKRSYGLLRPVLVV